MTSDPYFENAVKFKSSFDGRLKYFDTLEIYMETFAKALLTNNLRLQYLSLRGFYSWTAPFIKKEYNKKASELLETIRQNLHIQKPHIKAVMQEKLLFASELLNDNAKHLLLPTNLDEGEEVNWDEAI